VQLAMNSDLSHQFQTNEGNLEVEIIGDSVIFEKNVLQWEVKATRKISPYVDDNFIIQKILGLHIDTAKSILNNEIKLNDDPIIVISPLFWKYLPFLPFRINVVIDGK